ncbi:MAG: ribonuclease H [Desulfuromonadales bacterium C00003107]|nr:MAG: ribonuclease H [Desulfuromonadales bacterium C00003107]
MDAVTLFTDGSVNVQTKVGYGAYLAVSDPGLSFDELSRQVKVKRFVPTSSTKLELQTLLWALDDIQLLGRPLIVVTDSQNIIGLPARRDRLERNDYCSKKNTRLKNYELYQDFYRRFDQLDCELVKVQGHQASKHKNDIDRLFTLVDRASRNALREDARRSAL